MPATDDYGQGVQLYQLSERPDMEKAIADLAEGLVPRSVMRFLDAAERNATLTSPVAGMVAYLTNERVWTGWDGTQWVPLAGGADYDLLTSGTAATVAEISTGLQVGLTAVAGKAYRISFSGLVRSTVAGDRIEVLIRRGTTTSATQVGSGLTWVSAGNSGQTLDFSAVDIPGAGARTWTAFIKRSSGTGTVEITATATIPASLTVDSL